ncbi:hypothetical protein PSI23_20845 [Xenorhabdus sp. XENO-10]|uniref:Uncharacterized protein n=1 Tax=Xenorhabdus yunnanensis TaxID=3025878 RepID=A0ABT5LPI8_9GAMM|nr:hypothetical protein [Xenorhabdus yunnanensis]MDC9591660.1 hypothetical protein [Xenorhabdus yunnanensis]
MNRFTKVLFSVLLVSLSFSGHSFQASDEAINPYQTLITKKHTQHKHGYEHGYDHGYEHGYEHGYSHGYEHGYGHGYEHGHSNSIKHTYKSIKDAPQYPKGFRPVQDGTTRNVVNNKKVLQDLRAVRAGQWYKIYKNGYSASNQRVSIHYFQHKSGLVFDVKVHHGWSIRGS